MSGEKKLVYAIRHSTSEYVEAYLEVFAENGTVQALATRLGMTRSSTIATLHR